MTATDHRSEAAILEVLARETPGLAIVAEERGGVRADSMWAVDPLDGTNNFTRGLPVVAVSRGAGASLNGARLPQLLAVDPSRAVVATAYPFRKRDLLPRYRPVVDGATLVLEVGGRVSDWSGGETWLETGDVLAAAPGVHEALLDLAAKSPDR